MRVAATMFALAAVVAASGCKAPRTSSADSGASYADANATTGPGYLTRRIGFINIIEGSPFLVDGFGLESLHAEVNDAPMVPGAERVAFEGGCALYTHPPNGFCDPACVDSFCSSSGACVPYPRRVSAGEINVTGLRVPLVFEATNLGYASPHGEIHTDDYFDDGAEITASASGDQVGGFSITARGVPALDADLGFIHLDPKQTHRFEWVASGAGKIQVAIRDGWHGAPYRAMLLCEVDDVGELVLPQSLVQGYNDLVGSGEVHYYWLARFDRAVADTPNGVIELFVASMAFHFQWD